MDTMILGLILGVVAGGVSGLIGVGGGIIIIPTLVFLFHISQHKAQGTTLATMVPPIGILAAYKYYTKGYVDVTLALCIALGFIAGSYFGADLAVYISEKTLKSLFGIVLIITGIKLIAMG